MKGIKIKYHIWFKCGVYIFNFFKIYNLNSVEGKKVQFKYKNVIHIDCSRFSFNSSNSLIFCWADFSNVWCFRSCSCCWFWIKIDYSSLFSSEIIFSFSIKLSFSELFWLCFVWTWSFSSFCNFFSKSRLESESRALLLLRSWFSMFS